MIRDVLVTWVLLTQWQLQLNRLWCVSVRARRLIQGWIDSEKGTLLTATTDCPTKCLSNHHILRLLKTLDGWNCFQATQFVAVVSCFLSADICRCWWTGHCRRELRNLRNFTLLIPTSWIIYNTYIYKYIWSLYYLWSSGNPLTSSSQPNNSMLQPNMHVSILVKVSWCRSTHCTQIIVGNMPSNWYSS